MAVFMVLTYCINAVPFDAVAISSPSEIASLESISPGQTKTVEIPALGHEIVHHEAKAATCTEIGWNEYDTCSRCDYTTYVEIPALGHDLVHHDAQAATCTAIGWNAYDTCTRCDYTTYVEIPALGHDIGPGL